MRIVHASKAYWPHLGGIETVVRDLAEGMAHRGHRVTVMTAGPSSTCEVGHVLVNRHRAFGRVGGAPVAPGLLAAIARSSADVLHVHEPSGLPEIGLVLHARVRRMDGVRVLSWHSDLVRQRALARIFAPALAAAVDAADAVLVATPAHLNGSKILERAREKVRIVPFGVHVARYALTEEVATRAAEIRAELGGPIVLFIGRLVYYKGLDRLVAAADTLGDAQFVVIGAGPLEELVRSSAAFRKGRLTLRGPVPEHEKVAFLHACDVFVLPSTAVTEAYGIVQVEAMACGKPVVTFDLPTGVTWVNRDRETGLVARLSEPDSLVSAISALLRDSSWARELGAAGLARVRQDLDVALQVERTLEIYGMAGAGRLNQ